jgi:hypothetical protein
MSIADDSVLSSKFHYCLPLVDIFGQKREVLTDGLITKIAVLTLELEFLNFEGPQASIPQNRFLVRIDSVREIDSWGGWGGWGGGEPENEVEFSFKI